MLVIAALRFEWEEYERDRERALISSSRWAVAAF